MSVRPKVDAWAKTSDRRESLEIEKCWGLFTRHTSVVEPEETVRIALRIIAHKGFRHLPVVNRNREVVGVISAQDLVNAFSNVEEPSISDLVDHLLATRVSTLMSDTPITIRKDQTILDAIELMSNHNIGALPIVGEESISNRSSGENRLVGIITLRDIISMLAAFAPFGLTVNSYMTHEVEVVAEDDDVGLAIRSMSTRGVRRLPVVGTKESERVKGMVTNKMVLRLLESCLASNIGRIGINVTCKQPTKSIMISPMPTIDPNEDCGTASYLMRELGTGGFAVADSRGLLGIITERDIVRRIYKRKGISFFSELLTSRSQKLYV